jgi:hypothetical protein
MKRNVFGAAIVAGGLALFTSVAGFADYTTGPAAEAAVSKCASDARAALTVPTTLTGEALIEANALKAETTAGIDEIVAEANSNIKEAVAETTDEDGARDAAALTAELTAIVDESCKAIASLKAEFDKGIAELVAESTKVEQPEVNNVEKQDVEKQDVEKPEKHDAEKREKPEVHSTTPEGRD